MTTSTVKYRPLTRLDKDAFNNRFLSAGLNGRESAVIYSVAPGQGDRVSNTKDIDAPISGYRGAEIWAAEHAR